MLLNIFKTPIGSISNHKPGPEKPFSLTPELLQRILEKARPLGHHEKKENLNLGFGFVYYGLVRVLRPAHIVVIGSGYGFSVVCLALGCKDNGLGKVSFVDPGFSLFREGPFKTMGGTGKWKQPEQVKNHFEQFGVEEQITHFQLTSRDFFQSFHRFGLPPVGLGFIDGNHSFPYVREDFLALINRCRSGGYLFLHDTHIYIRETLRHAGVKKWIKRLKDFPDLFEVIDFPFSSGVALVRILPKRKKLLNQWIKSLEKREAREKYQISK